MTPENTTHENNGEPDSHSESMLRQDAFIAETPPPPGESFAIDISEAHPRENPYFIGHRDSEKKFLTAWHSSYRHPVYLISGAHGIGKATFAYRIARYVLSGSHNPDSADSDFNSGVCRQVAANSHANLMVLEPGLPKLSESGVSNEITVGWVRKMTTRATQTRAQKGWRVYIIDKIDDASRSAVNALLKILEEPPPESLFLLTSDAPFDLPATVRSRCQEIHLNRPSLQEIQDFLTMMEINPDPIAIESLAQLSDGRIGRALIWERIEALKIYDRFIEAMETSLTPQAKQSHADITALAETIASQDAKEKTKSEQYTGHSFNAFATMIEDYLGKAIFAFATGAEPEVIRSHIDSGLIAKLMTQRQNVKNWLELRSLVQSAARRCKPPLRLEKQQSALEILWRMRYACNGDWEQALKKYA